MGSLVVPDDAIAAAISKDAILLQQTRQYKQANASLPLIWQRLVLPALLAKLRCAPAVPVSCSEQTLLIDLQTIVKGREQRQRVLQVLCRYDYLRRGEAGDFVAGTRLWTDVNAARMMKALNVKLSD